MKKIISAVITAAGNGIRFGGDKMMVLLKGQPILLHTLRQFQQAEKINEIIVAARKIDIDKYKKIIKKAGLQARVVEGGLERIISVYNGIRASRGEFIITHDGNRPLTPVWLINKIIEEVIRYGAVTTAVPPTSTIKYADGFIVKKSLPRHETWIGQTPQAFKRLVILTALERAIKDKCFVATDDCDLVARMGNKVRIVHGDEINIKITFPKDVIIAEQLLNLIKK